MCRVPEHMIVLSTLLIDAYVALVCCMVWRIIQQTTLALLAHVFWATMVVNGLAATRLRVRVGRRLTRAIPKEAREKLGIREGDELDLVVVDDSIIIGSPCHS